MSIESPLFRTKSQKELREQLIATSQYAEDIINTTVIPPHLSKSRQIDSLVSTDVNELIAQYPVRMDAYTSLLHARKQGIELSEEEKNKYHKSLQLLNNLDRYIISHSSQSRSERTLRERQFSVFEDLRDFLEQGNTEGYIKLPTGVGKTVLFTEFVEATNLKSLIVVPTIDLVTQTEEKFQQFASELQVGKVFRGKKDYGRQVTIITYQSLVHQLKNGQIKPEDYDLLILDEVHQSLGKERAHAVSQFENAIKIGFTATPKYSKDRQVKNILNNEIHTMTIQEASKEQLLSPFRVWLVNTDIDLSKVTVDSDGNYDLKTLEEAINIEKRNRAAVELYEQQFSGHSALAFCVSVKHAQDVARQFNERGVTAEAVYGGMDPTKRDEILTKFKKGEIKILCNMQVLTEGFDAPNASVCFNLRPILSPVVAEQRGGRVLRLDPNNPHKEAFIIDFIDKEERIGKQPISFAEVAGIASTLNVPTFLQNHNENWLQQTMKDNEEVESQEEQVIKLGDFEVIMDVKEIMRIVNEVYINRMSENYYPEGFIKMPIMEIASEFKLLPQTIRKYLKEMKDNFPSYFQGGGRGFGSEYIGTADGIIFFREWLKQRDERRPKTFIEEDLFPLPTGLLSEKYNINPKTIRKKITQLAQHNPNEFQGGGMGGNPHMISSKGLQLIEDELVKVKTVKVMTGIEGLSYINTAELANQFHCSTTTIQRNIQKLAQSLPNDFLQEEKGQPYFGSEIGIKLLLESLESKFSFE